MAEELTMTLTINGTAFSATLEDNETSQALVAMLPMTLSMSELNRNEKYCYLDTTLPQDATNPGTIQAGDIMLYGSDCLVLFYKSHSTRYSYTRIGRLDDVEGLSDAVGADSVQVNWE